MNITTTFLGIVSLAIVGPLALALVLAAVMVWLSRQTSAAPSAGVPASAPAARSPAAAAPATAVPRLEQQVETVKAELFATEAASFEREETHRRLVPTWLVVVYAVVILWALVYILIEVVPFFKPLVPQNAPVPALVSPTATVAPRSAISTGQGNAANGEKLFASQGCSACHSLKEGEKIIGPPLYHVGQIALSRIKDVTYKGKAQSAEEYIRESILEPNAAIVPGFPAGVMPQDFRQKLNAQDLDDLVAFLMTR